MTGAAGVGVAEHGNSAELVTLSRAGEFLDRRRIDLTQGLPTHPYHHEGSWAVGRYVNSPWARQMSLPDAIALVERVHAAADEGARAALDALAATVAEPIGVIALRVCAVLPATIEERIMDARAATMADSIMYRQALAKGARALGWRVVWYDRDDVFAKAEAALGDGDIQAFLTRLGRSLGPPWQARHKLAAAAAMGSV